MSNSKRKRNRPNLAEHEIYFRAGRYVKHRHCNNFIVSKEAGRPEVGKKASLECSKCHRKVGRKGYQEIAETTEPELENVVGLGIRWIFLTPEEENPIVVDRDHPLFTRAFSEEAERGVSRQQASDMVAFIAQDMDTSGTVTGRTGRTSPSSALTRDRLKRIKRRALAKRKLTEAAALGRAAAKSVQLEGRGLPEQALEDLAGMGCYSDPAPFKEARLAYIEKAKEELERCQFDGDAAPAWAVRAVNQHQEARRERAGRIRLDKAIDYEDKVTSLKGCVTGRTETGRELRFRLEHAKRVKREISDWYRGGFMSQKFPDQRKFDEEYARRREGAAHAARRRAEAATGMTWRSAGPIEDTIIKAATRYGSEIECARADIVRCKARGDAPPDWAVRAVKQHKEARRARRPRFFVDAQVHDDDAKRRAASQATCQGRVETPEEKKTRFEHKKAMRDYFEKKRFDSGYVNAKQAEFVSLAEKKRFYEEN